MERAIPGLPEVGGVVSTLRKRAVMPCSGRMFRKVRCKREFQVPGEGGGFMKEKKKQKGNEVEKLSTVAGARGD